MAEEIEQEITEYRIHETSMGWLDKKFKRMAKVAGQVGAKPPTYTILRGEYVERKKQLLGDDFEQGTGEYDRYYIITVEGEPPKLAGWSFVATLTHTKDGNLINKVPGTIEDVSGKYRTASPTCDYCGLIRKRTDSFIVRSDAGEYKQVGRNCLAKFLGYSNPERVAGYAAMLANIRKAIEEQEEKLFSGGGHGSDYRDLLSFLTMVVAVIEEHGWVSVAKARERDVTPTIREVEFQLSPDIDKKDYRHLKITPTDEHKSRAQEAIDFARSEKLTTDSDYKHNLKVSTAGDMFHNKASGVVASLIAFEDHDKEWERVQQQRREESEKRKDEYRKSEYLGDIGERITVNVRVVRRMVLDSPYGVTYLFRMLDGENNVVVWFSSNDILEEDQWYTLIGTVKKHDRYDDIKQTVLTRCKIVPDVIDSPVVPTVAESKKKIATKKKRRKSHRKTTEASIGEMRI